MDRDAVRLFQHLLKDSLRDIDKLLKITVDSKNSFRDKYINEKKYLQNFHDVGVAKEKYLAFLGNLVNSAKRIEDTFFSSIEPLISSADSKRAVARTASSPSSTRESSDACKLSNGVVNKSSVEGTEESNLEDEVEKKSSKMEVDGDNDDDTDVNATKSQNTSTGSTDVEETSLPAHRKSTSSNQKDADDENDASSSSSERKEDSRENGREKSSPDASMTNSVEISNKMEGNDDDETTITDTGVSDSMIVNLGTEDESVISEKDSKAESSKEKSDDDLPEESNDENGKSGESERERKSLVSGNNCKSLDVSDIDGGGSNSSTMKDKSNEEFAKNDLLRNSEISSENETDDNAVKKHSRENDSTLSSGSPSHNMSLEIGDSKEKLAKSDILNGSEEDDDKNYEIKSKDIVDDNSTENIAKSKEKNAKKELLESSDSSANDDHSKSSSDSGMSGVGVLQKNSDNKKSV